MNETRIKVVRAIGSGEQKKHASADEIAATAPEGFDPKVRGAVAELIRDWLGVTLEDCPAQADSQKRKTAFGEGFGLLVSAVKSRLSEKPDTDWLRLVALAAKNAQAHEFDADTIIRTVEQVVMDRTLIDA